MKGMRAMELSTDGFKDWLAELFQFSSVQLIQRMQNAPVAVVEELTAEFTEAVGFVDSQLHSYFSYEEVGNS